MQPVVAGPVLEYLRRRSLCGPHPAREMPPRVLDRLVDRQQVRDQRLVRQSGGRNRRRSRRSRSLRVAPRHPREARAAGRAGSASVGIMSRREMPRRIRSSAVPHRRAAADRRGRDGGSSVQHCQASMRAGSGRRSARAGWTPAYNGDDTLAVPRDLTINRRRAGARAPARDPGEASPWPSAAARRRASQRRQRKRSGREPRPARIRRWSISRSRCARGPTRCWASPAPPRTSRWAPRR